MREIRPSGSEGGVAFGPSLPLWTWNRARPEPRQLFPERGARVAPRREVVHENAAEVDVAVRI
jgi:hypothetical protein